VFLRNSKKVVETLQLQKPNKIRLGNWQVDVLSKEQLQYAATDAFASWQLYQVNIRESSFTFTAVVGDVADINFLVVTQVLKSLPDAKDATDPTSKELKVEST
jgi:hypothetical protein